VPQFDRAVTACGTRGEVDGACTVGVGARFLMDVEWCTKAVPTGQGWRTTHRAVRVE